MFCKKLYIFLFRVLGHKKIPLSGAIKEKARRRAVFPALSRPGIVAAAVLNFRVRDGNGCDHRAIATGLFLPPGFPRARYALWTPDATQHALPRTPRSEASILFFTFLL